MNLTRSSLSALIWVNWDPAELRIVGCQARHALAHAQGTSSSRQAPPDDPRDNALRMCPLNNHDYDSIYRKIVR